MFLKIRFIETWTKLKKIYGTNDECKENWIIVIYYEILYLSINSDITNIDLEEIINCEFPKLEPNDSTSLDKEIYEREVLEVLRNMKNNKSPESIGFTVFKLNPH